MSKTTLATDTGHLNPRVGAGARPGVSAASEWGHGLRLPKEYPRTVARQTDREVCFLGHSPLWISGSLRQFVRGADKLPGDERPPKAMYFYWEALGSRGQRESMMEDLEKTKPVAEPAMDDDETGAGCEYCMPPLQRFWRRGRLQVARVLP